MFLHQTSDVLTTQMKVSSTLRADSHSHPAVGSAKTGMAAHLLRPADLRSELIRSAQWSFCTAGFFKNRERGWLGKSQPPSYFVAALVVSAMPCPHCRVHPFTLRWPTLGSFSQASSSIRPLCLRWPTSGTVSQASSIITFCTRFASTSSLARTVHSLAHIGESFSQASSTLAHIGNSFPSLQQFPRSARALHPHRRLRIPYKPPATSVKRFSGTRWL